MKITTQNLLYSVNNVEDTRIHRDFHNKSLEKLQIRNLEINQNGK